MKHPCDEAALRSGGSGAACADKSRPWVLAATILGSSMAFIDGTVVNVALPALQSSLHATVVDVQWVVESYGLFLSALILVGGAMGDVFGRRAVFLSGVVLFAIASVGCGISASVASLIIWRCVQGIAAAFLVPGSLSIISAAFDEKSRGQAIGTWSGFTAITTALGPVLGGWLIEHASWHWIFFLNVPLALAVIGISLRHIPESRSDNPQALDWMGAFTATVGLAGLVYGFLESSNLGWKNPRVPGSLAAGIVFLTWFALTEKRVASPMVPLQLFKSRSFTGANLLTLFLYAALGIFFFVVPLNLIQVQTYSATRTGLALLPIILLLFFLSRWSGGLVARYGSKKPLIIGPLTAAVGFLLFAVPSAGSNYWTSFFPAFIVLGFGMAVSVAPLTTVVMSSVEQNRVGTASGINNAVARVAGVLAIAVFGIVMVIAFSHALQQSLATVGLPANVLQDVQSNAARLGGINVPSNLEPQTKTAIQHAVRASFIFGFRIIVSICGALAAASAVVAWRMIPSGRS